MRHGRETEDTTEKREHTHNVFYARIAEGGLADRLALDAAILTLFALLSFFVCLFLSLVFVCSHRLRLLLFLSFALSLLLWLLFVLLFAFAACADVFAAAPEFQHERHLTTNTPMNRSRQRNTAKRRWATHQVGEVDHSAILAMAVQHHRRQD